jgi:hypothetical protein
VVINAAKGLPAAVQQGIAAARADIENACATAKTASSTRAALDAPKPRGAASAASAGNPVAGQAKSTRTKPARAARSAVGSVRAGD